MKNYFLTENPLRFNLESLLKYFQMSFVYESPHRTLYVTVAEVGVAKLNRALPASSATSKESWIFESSRLPS